MPRASIIRVAVWLLAAAFLGACTPTSPLANAQEPVRTALDPFLKEGFECAGPSKDQSNATQWMCTKTSSDGVVYSIIVDADVGALRNVLAIVDQSEVAETTPTRVTEFFTHVADMNLGGSNQDVKDWINTHVSEGGQKQIGPVLVTLDALAPVDHLNLFASG